MGDMNSNRGALTARTLPQMQLSDGSQGSMTGPPPPIPHYLNSAGRAQMRFNVEGSAVITGGLGTLGLESARALLEHGCTGLALLDRDITHARDAISALRLDFPDVRIMPQQVDVTDQGQVEAAFEHAAVTLGGIDMLLCFAGVVGCIHAIEMGHQEWRRTLDVNTTGSFVCAQAAAKLMIKQKSGGSIVLIASISAHRVNFPQPQVAYNVSKGAILNLKSSLAAEWARYGIRVNSISPGYMDTILNEGDGLEDARRSWAARNPMGRMGSPSELTGVVVLLCSAAGSYINGADIIVDGGATVF
ncbi:MAG: hypothetical protein M1825_003969 [Sarcosagium campestre]|nr:MAG: hypothetical protein M1825_003969 [Sarcosagium campestre]